MVYGCREKLVSLVDIGNYRTRFCKQHMIELRNGFNFQLSKLELAKPKRKR